MCCSETWLHSVSPSRQLSKNHSQHAKPPNCLQTNRTRATRPHVHRHRLPLPVCGARMIKGAHLPLQQCWAVAVGLRCIVSDCLAESGSQWQQLMIGMAGSPCLIRSGCWAHSGNVKWQCKCRQGLDYNICQWPDCKWRSQYCSGG